MLNFYGTLLPRRHATSNFSENCKIMRAIEVLTKLLICYGPVSPMKVFWILSSTYFKPMLCLGRSLQGEARGNVLKTISRLAIICIGDFNMAAKEEVGVIEPIRNVPGIADCCDRTILRSLVKRTGSASTQYKHANSNENWFPPHPAEHVHGSAWKAVQLGT